MREVHQHSPRNPWRDGHDEASNPPATMRAKETVMTRINQKHDAPSKNVVESLQGLAAMEEHFGLLSCADNDLFTKVTSPH